MNGNCSTSLLIFLGLILLVVLVVMAIDSAGNLQAVSSSGASVPLDGIKYLLSWGK